MGIFKRKKVNLDTSRLPFHIGFIIDGNGRWAKLRGLPRTVGHRQGVLQVKETVQNCYDLGIKQISFFCFSTENWNRPQGEIDAIFRMLKEFVNEDVEPYVEKDIKLMISGNMDGLPTEIANALKNAEEKTKNCKKMIVNLCINYGGKDDILQAVNELLKQDKKQVTFEEFEKKLYSKDLFPLDFVVRTSGEQRISNFMLYQMAYAEFYFTSTFWPDFNKQALHLALKDFERRNRRYGSIKQ